MMFLVGLTKVISLLVSVLVLSITLTRKPTWNAFHPVFFRKFKCLPVDNLNAFRSLLDVSAKLLYLKEC